MKTAQQIKEELEYTKATTEKIKTEEQEEALLAAQKELIVEIEDKIKKAIKLTGAAVFIADKWIIRLLALATEETKNIINSSGYIIDTANELYYDQDNKQKYKNIVLIGSPDQIKKLKIEASNKQKEDDFLDKEKEIHSYYYEKYAQKERLDRYLSVTKTTKQNISAIRVFFAKICDKISNNRIFKSILYVFYTLFVCFVFYGWFHILKNGTSHGLSDTWGCYFLGTFCMLIFYFIMLYFFESYGKESLREIKKIKCVCGNEYAIYRDYDCKNFYFDSKEKTKLEENFVCNSCGKYVFNINCHKNI